MDIISTPISDVRILVPVQHRDDRGRFMEMYRADWFEEYVASVRFVQDNYSESHQGVLRGMHYQMPYAQGKLVSVVYGAIFDVVVDLRLTSSTFGQWFGTVLSDENGCSLWVPEGFAHGFYTLSDQARCCYRCTDYYHPESQHTLMWNDRDVGIQWEGLIGEPILSEKDAVGRSFAESVYFDR